MSGDFGIGIAPVIQDFTGDDPDDGDDVYGASDTLLIEFNMATNRADGDPFGDKAWVDDLLWFSLTPGDDYSGIKYKVQSIPLVVLSDAGRRLLRYKV